LPLLFVILALAAVTTYLLLHKKEAPTQEKKEEALAISKNSDAFNASFGTLMTGYYALKNALVDWDTAAVNRASLSVQGAADSLQLKELKADSGIVLTAQNLASSISSEAQGLAAEKSIEEKRKDFNALTDQLYNLVMTVRYDRQRIYHIRCPMALGDSVEGYWLSNSSAVINPYLGKKHPFYKDKMLGCGEVVDSLDFAKK
ncbi:MAG TPA: DUF3347 domain-containing protein, partial [Puia sp.]|nr:DUF3347 domain-containing protein [Puia sp.]